ncbi:MAG: PDZ domain-containing protein [Rubrivivax sp.]|nr:PDZ domain-containing protein [Rubrivivax sp.]
MLPVRSRPSFLALCLLLAACGGGGDGGGTTPPAPEACSVAAQNAWLATYFDDWYFWYRQAPRPDAAAYGSVQAYFEARRYTGSDAAFPADRWSYEQSTAEFNRTFGDGVTLGYGVAVTGVEADGDATRPLWVRYVDPGSPAEAAGVQRGDRVISLNGRAVEGLIATRDYSLLTAAQAGDTLTLGLRRAGTDRTVVLTAALYSLVPVPRVAVRETPGGRKLGLLQVQQMISQSLAPMDSAFAQFLAAGVNDLVLDLRYNGGGLVSTGGMLASYIAGSRAAGLAYARLVFNDKHAASNATYGFSQPAAALSLPRVYVLAGPRTCSASEQVIAGLRGAGIEVVLVGDTTCGKPVGFQPASNCGRTYSVVNFESVNQRGEGRYFDGLAAHCPVPEDFSVAQGSDADPLLAAAAQLADGGACPRAAPLDAPQVRRGAAAAVPGVMLAR